MLCCTAAGDTILEAFMEERKIKRKVMTMSSGPLDKESEVDLRCIFSTGTTSADDHVTLSLFFIVLCLAV